MRSKLVIAACALVLVLAPSAAQAQRKTRPKAIEIRGQVPTPQVVTVRPREVPAYSRQVISPTFYNHDFWPSILPAYLLVPQRMITGTAPMDSLMRGDGTVPAATTPASPAAMPGTTTPPDSTRPPSGTPPARTQR